MPTEPSRSVRRLHETPKFRREDPQEQVPPEQPVAGSRGTRSASSRRSARRSAAASTGTAPSHGAGTRHRTPSRPRRSPTVGSHLRSTPTGLTRPGRGSLGPPLPADGIWAAAAPRGGPQRRLRSTRCRRVRPARPLRVSFSLCFSPPSNQPCQPQEPSHPPASCRRLSQFPPGSPISFPYGFPLRAQGAERKCSHFASRVYFDLLVVVPESQGSSLET